MPAYAERMPVPSAKYGSVAELLDAATYVGQTSRDIRERSRLIRETARKACEDSARMRAERLKAAPTRLTP